MNIGLVIGFVLAIVVAVVSFWIFASSSKWLGVQGKIENSEMKENYQSQNTIANNVGSLFDYKIELKYSYEYEGKRYEGKNIYPGLPNVFSEKKLAEEALNNYRPGASVTVFIDPKKPSRSGLVTSKSIGVKGIVTLGGLVLFILVFVAGGFYILNKF